MWQFFTNDRFPKTFVTGAQRATFTVVYRLSWRVFKFRFTRCFKGNDFFFFDNLHGPSSNSGMNKTASVATKVIFNALYFILKNIFKYDVFLFEGVVCVVAFHLGDLTS